MPEMESAELAKRWLAAFGAWRSPRIARLAVGGGLVVQPKSTKIGLGRAAFMEKKISAKTATGLPSVSVYKRFAPGEYRAQEQGRG
jgi:hypothetical protein